MRLNILPAMASASAGVGSVRPVDPVAAARTRLRLESAPAAPWLHEEAARRMAERLVLLRQAPQRVIDWWSHAGGSSAALMSALPRAQFERRGLRVGQLVEPATGWRRWWPGTRSKPQEPAPQTPADMVWANMLLHHVCEPLALMQQWHAQLAVDGILMFSTLGPGSLPSLRRLYRAEAFGPAMADLVDMHDIGDQLVEAGFADPVMDQEIVRLTWSSARAALQELRSLGSNLSLARQPGLRTPRWQERLLKAMEQDAQQAGLARVTLEFELVYGHAFKAPPVHRVEPQTHIALDDMRDSLKRKRNEPYR